MHMNRRAVLAGAMSLATASTLKAQTPSTIELWSFLDPAGDNVRSKALKAVIDSFEAANLAIKVRTTVVQWQELSPQLLRSARAGRGPDVAMIFSPQLQVHIAAGTILPLGDRIAAMPDGADIAVLSEGRDRQGKVYALPWELRVSGILVRKDLLDAAGLKLPQTLEEMATTGAKLGTDGRIGFGLGFKSTNPDAAMGWFMPAAVSTGANVLDADGKPSFNSPGLQKTVQYVRDLVHKYKASPLDAMLQGDTEVQQLSETGRTIFAAKGSHRLLFIQEKSGLGNKIQIMTPPGFEAGKPAPALTQGWSLAIPKTSAQQDAAFRFIQHWTSAPVQLAQSQAAGYLPVRSSLSASPALADDKFAHIRWAVDYAVKHPMTFNWPENQDLLNSTLAGAVEQVVSNRMSVSDALVAAEKAYVAGRR